MKKTAAKACSNFLRTPSENSFWDLIVSYSKAAALLDPLFPEKKEAVKTGPASLYTVLARIQHSNSVRL